MLNFKANFNVTTRTKINFNGREYVSVDDMPPEVPAAYQEARAAVARLAAGGAAKTEIRIVINGQEYSSVEDMPPETRRTYEGLLARMGGTGQGAPGIPLPPAPNAIQATRTVAPPRPVTGQPEVAPDTPSALAASRSERPSAGIWSVLFGAVSFGLILAHGGRLEGKNSLSLNSPWALLLAVPVAFFLHAAYLAFRGPRCPYCRAALPARQPVSGPRQCPRCRRELDRV